MAKEKKEFRVGIYAVLVGVILAVILAALTVYAFTTRYTAFSPEKVAQQYVDTIVQTGDGYNAYKNTLVSQNEKIKYGDFIRRAYMKPYVNDGDGVEQAAFVGTGSDEEQAKIDEVYNTMYDYYVELIHTYGWDDYDAIYDHYFAKLVEVRKAVYGDEFMNMDYMFGALEANVATYGEYLTGVERQIASDNKTILREYEEGAYQQMFGTQQEVEAEDVVDGKKQTVTESRLVYHLTSSVTSCEELSADEVKAYVEGFKERIAPVAAQGEAKAAAAGLDEENSKNMVDAFAKLDCSDSIESVAKATVDVTLDDGTVVATQEVYVVKIGSSWYVDNTNIDTTGLYLAK